MRRFFWPWVLVVLVLASGCASPPVRQSPWVVVNSPRFEILSSLSAEETQALARELERFHALIYAVTGTQHIEAPIPTRIYAFKKLRDYEKYAPRRSAGFFIAGLRTNTMVLGDASNRQGALEIILHEYTHFVLENGSGFEYPVWYNEGFADLLSSARTHGEMVALGAIPKYRIASFQTGPWMSIEKVISATGYDSVKANDLHMLYAEAWALVHYLTLDRPESGSTKKQLSRYIRLVESGTTPAKAFEEAFGERPADVGLKIQKVLERAGPTLKVIGIPIENLTYDRSEPTVRVAQTAEVATRLGQLQLRVGNAAGAKSEFKAAVALEPANPRALAGLGDALKQQEDWQGAEPYFRKAVALAPDDVLNQIDLAEFLHDRALHATSQAARSQDLAEARKLYARCREIDDQLPEPWVMEGRTHLVPGEDPLTALPLLQRGLELLPSSAGILESLAEAHVLIGREKLASKLLARAYASRMDGGLQSGTADWIRAVKKKHKELAQQVKRKPR